MKITAVYVALLTALVMYLFFGHNGILKYRELVEIKNGYERRIDNMEVRIKELSKELELIKKDKEYLELLIRKELHMRSPDEDLYIIDENAEIHSNGDNGSD
ncbi:FtsB family cell division protein [Limisalsivibrio acetivorans]|uniref:FtsB family cell division protein n=1 Tax=Limisalsivibrio acetivorans TaxID=1304888 RepID=UPI0003B47E16|nr:septum formation initiator family protein [Limisalsivibrio acetivorans]